MLARNTDTGTEKVQIVVMNVDEQMIVTGTNTRPVDPLEVLWTPQMHLRRQAKPRILGHVTLQTQIEVPADLFA